MSFSRVTVGIGSMERKPETVVPGGENLNTPSGKESSPGLGRKAGVGVAR